MDDRLGTNGRVNGFGLLGRRKASGFGLSGVKKTKMKEVTLSRKDFEVHESRNGGRRGSTSWGLNVSSSLCLRE